MNPIRFLSIALLFVLPLSTDAQPLLSGIQQELQVNTQANRVIANGGLRLREQPGKKSKIITTLPFGTDVVYVSQQSFGTDSILVNDTYIYGSWVKVKSQKQTGYVLDIYLDYWEKHRSIADETVNEQFVLLFPGCDCNQENIYNPDSWTWYGYFKSGDGQYTVETVDISYYRTQQYTCDLLINASKIKNLEFIIGTKGPHPGKKAGTFVGDVSLRSYPNSPINHQAIRALSLELEVADNGYSNQLYLVKNNQKQLLSRPEYDYPASVIFAGDMDGDGVLDYLICYGDKSAVIGLYLSGQATKGEFIRLMSFFYSGYCC